MKIRIFILSFIVLSATIAFTEEFVPVKVDGDNQRVGIQNMSPESTLDVLGNIAFRSKIVTSAHTLDTEFFLIVEDGGVDVTITLPTASGATNRLYTVASHYNNTKTVIIDGAGSETINGQATFVLFDAEDTLGLISLDTEWIIK